MARVFLLDDQINAFALAEAIEEGTQTEHAPIDLAGTFSAPPPVYSIPPSLCGTPPGVILISHATWIEVVTKLAILTAKVGHMEGKV